MLTVDFNRVIDHWINDLEQYDFAQLSAKPSAKSWSLGQLYMHLISETRYFIEQIKVCTGINDNEFEEASPAARTMFVNKNFPDEIIEGPPSNADTPQPDSKPQLLNDLLNLKDEMNNAGILILKSSFKGKTKHPGLNYFNAHEWLHFAEMHFRHHLRQKNRLDVFLKTREAGS